MMAYGWSPGQIPLASAILRTNRRMLQAMIEAAMAPLEEAAGDQVAVYFPEDASLGERSETAATTSRPWSSWTMTRRLPCSAIKALGWVRPHDTDPNSTNCLLNSFANLPTWSRWDTTPTRWNWRAWCGRAI